MRRHGRGMGRGRMNPDRFDYYDDGHHEEHHGDHYRDGMGYGFGHRGFHHHGRSINRPSTTERIDYLEDIQRNLEEMTADLADQLDGLRRRESVRPTS